MHQGFFLSLIDQWHILGYAAVFIGLILEGDTVLFIAAFLTHQGLFDIWYLLLTVFSSVIIGDILWYIVGYHTRDSRFWLFRWAHGIGRHFDRYLTKRPLYTIFISKFTYGVHHLILMRAGVVNISLKDFIRKDIIATLVWVAIVGGLGYFSGFSFYLLRRYIRLTEIGFLAIMVALLFLEHFIINRKLKKNLN